MRTAAVDIWTVPLDREREPLLSLEERERAGRFRSEQHKMHWTNAHSALREIVSQYLQQDPLSLHFTCNAHGKPAIEGVEFNLSHSGAFAMVAISREFPVGVDVERLRPAVDMATLLERLGEQDLPADTDALHQRWTRREAASKAQGGQLFDAIDATIKVADLVAPEQYFASVALVGAVPVANYCGKR